MTINSNTQSFSSLNGAIKVTQISQPDSSSTTQTKKLNDSISVNISSNSEPLKEETVIQARNGYVNPEQEARIKMLNDYYPKVVEENNQFEVTGLGKSQMIAKNNAIIAANTACGKKATPIVADEKSEYNGALKGVFDEETGKMITAAAGVIGSVMGKGGIEKDTDYQTTLTFTCKAS